MTRDEIQKIYDDASVSMAAAPDFHWLRHSSRLEPRLWEALRLELQRRFRRSTGEEFAVLMVEINPRETEGGRNG